MIKTNSPTTSILVIPAIILLFLVVSGCSFFANEVRYTKNTRQYTIAQNRGTDVSASPLSASYNVGHNDNLTAHYTIGRNGDAVVYTTSAHRGTTYTVGPNDSLTEHYILKQGNYSINQPPPSASDMAEATGQAMSANTGGTQDSGGKGQQDAMQIVLEASNILFDFDKYSIKREYFDELNRWAAFFQDNPQVSAEIHGHTDNIGTIAYNQKLSERRARAVINYLAGKGIDPVRFTAIGFSENQPVAPNTTPEGRQQNRRVEVDF